MCLFSVFGVGGTQIQSLINCSHATVGACVPYFGMDIELWHTMKVLKKFGLH